MIESMFLTFSSIAAIASIVGAIFAVWRWDYAKKAFHLQEKQLYLQILMLAESREYWYAPKMDYVKRKKKDNQDIDLQISKIIKELKMAYNE